jgi:peroxiredoxin
MPDMREYSANLLVIGKNRQRVSAEAGSATEEQTRLNEWFQGLINGAKIERFKAPGSGPAPRVGAEAPDFTLKDLQGNEVKLSSLRGKPVMINFWATWCPPCREEIPVITKMYGEREGGSSYEVLGVATQSDTSTIRAFAAEFGMDFPLLPDVNSNVVSTYHVLPIPTTFFVDKDGIIRFIQTGPVTRVTMEEWLLGE